MDLGVSCWRDKVDEHFTPMIQSPSFRAPEVALLAGWNTPCDIWSVGALVLELLTGRPLFPPDVTPTGLVALMAVHFGDFPPVALRARGENTPMMFKEDGSFLIEITDHHLVEDVVRRRMSIALSPEQEELLFSFLRQAFTYMPEDRPSARQLMEHKWLLSIS